MLSTADRLEIRELVDLYGHLVDERQYSRLGELVIPDVVSDATGRGAGVFRGREEMQAGLEAWAGRQGSTPDQQVAHHATNVVVQPVDADCAKVVYSGLVVHAAGTVHSNVYRMTVVRTDNGWRVSHVAVSMRTPETVPDIS